jgi:dihydroceramidase
MRSAVRARAASLSSIAEPLADFSVMLPNPVYHQVAFALIMTSSVLRSAQLIFRLPEAMRAKLARTLGGGVGVFVLGFAIWNADNYFCVYLRSTRAWLTAHGLGPLGTFTEGHGYWHLMTGYGAYRIFIACIQLCLAIKTSPSEWDYDEKLWFPIVRRVKPVARDAKAPVESDSDASADEKRKTGAATP